MYEEEKKGSGAFIKDLIIKLLYMLLFLFLFMWLYPAPKVDLSDVKVKVDKSELEPLFAGIFNDNITSMKNAARAYFTTDRLPSTNGGTVKMTLQDMLNKKMLVPFVDSNGKSCDANASYVEVTRNSTYDYNLKVYLSCSDKQDYIIETIGCTSICPGCVNAPVAASTSTVSKSSGYGGGTTTTTTIVRPSTTTQTVTPTPSTPNPPSEQKENITVYFDAKGGSSVNSQTIPKGNKIYNPTTNRDGYKFLCWSKSNNDTSCTNTHDFNSPVYSSMTLYAQWVAENKVVYEYVKDTSVWNTDNTWVTTKKTTSSTVKLVDTRTRTEDSRVKKTYTYRTVSWIFGQDSGESYSLYLNNIPSDASDVKITSQSKFSSTSELKAYANNRYTCVIEMVGYGCPQRGASADIQNEDLYYTQVANFSYSSLSIQKMNGKWTVPVSYRNNNIRSGDWSQYIAPIKFTVQWYEGNTKNITEYKYSYKTTTQDYKYSTNKNDTSLLNAGYRLTGKTM